MSFTCTTNSPTATAPVNGQIVFTLSASAPHADCTATYRLDPPAVLHVVKTVAGPDAARPGDAYIEVACSDGAFGTRRCPGRTTRPVPASATGTADPHRIGDLHCDRASRRRSTTRCRDRDG